MRRSLTAIGLGVAMLLTGCGVAGETPVAANPESSTTQPTTDQLPTIPPPSAPAPAPSSCAALEGRHWTATPRPTTDPAALARSTRLAGLPVTGLAPRTVTEVTPFVTAQDYLDRAEIPDPAARLRVMARDGFRGGVGVGFASGADIYGVNTLRFASPAAALDYFAVHLRNICAVSLEAIPLSGMSGVSYLRDDDLAKATFIAGDTEIQLDVCSCVEVNDRPRLAGLWAAAIARQLGDPPAKPTSGS